MSEMLDNQSLNQSFFMLKRLYTYNLLNYLVGRQGLEPWTYGLRVLSYYSIFQSVALNLNQSLKHCEINKINNLY